MDTKKPGPFGIERGRIQRLVSLGQRYAEAETTYHRSKAEVWNEISAAMADLQTELPELVDVLDIVVADFASMFATGHVPPTGGNDCGHDHAPVEPQTAADAVELGARQTAEELAQGQATAADDDSATPAAVRVPTLRMPVIGTPQDRVLAVLRSVWPDGDNGEPGVADLVDVQTMTGLNPLTAAKALGALVKAGKAIKVDDNTYRFAG